MKMTTRKYDIVVWGCTGFTGKLTCEYLHKNYSALKIAIAGRNKNKIDEIVKKLNLPNTIDILIGDLNDSRSLENITSQTKVLLTTAGPYAKIGTPIVAACVATGTHYCDLTGESPWIRKVIDNYHTEAAKKHLKIVNCCGFDCIPCDLGTQMIVDEMKSKDLQPQEVRFLAGDANGGASGGTLASIFNIFETLSFKELLQLSNPFYLNPRESTLSTSNNNNTEDPPAKPHNDKSLYLQSCDNAVMGYDNVDKTWTMPYVMQAIDTRLVNRSNALTGWSYGRNFVFSERMKIPNVFGAALGTFALTTFQLLLVFPVTRVILKRLLPQPGQGPSQEILDNGYFTATMWGKGLDTKSGKSMIVKGSVEGRNGDPGYRLTAKMISEAAVCLATDQLPDTYGVLTPSVAMGKTLRERLSNNGIYFRIEK